MFNIEKIVLKKLKSLSQSQHQQENKLRALDLGCGEGYWSIKLAELGFIVDSVDKQGYKLETLKNKAGVFLQSINVYNNDVLEFNFLKEYYDVVICFNLLHLLRIKSALKIINNIYKTTKTGGYCFVIFKVKEKFFKLLNTFPLFFDIAFCQFFKSKNADNIDGIYIFLELIKPPTSLRFKKALKIISSIYI